MYSALPGRLRLTCTRAGLVPAAKLGAGATEPLALPMPAAGVSAEAGSAKRAVVAAASAIGAPVTASL